jgi:DNA replication and repair protein RecF
VDRLYFYDCILEIGLRAFRSYEDFFHDFGDHQGTLLLGANGCGKTNLLEALSLLSPGKGLRHCSGKELHCFYDKRPWKISIKLPTPDWPLEITIAQHKEGKQIFVNGGLLKSHLELEQWVVVQWVTPVMEKIFISGATERRRFFDRLIFSLFPQYGYSLSRMTKMIKERMEVLTHYNLREKNRWLCSIESLIAQEMAFVFHTRLKALGLLNAEMAWESPWAVTTMTGAMESFLKKDWDDRGSLEDTQPGKPERLPDDCPEMLGYFQNQLQEQLARNRLIDQEKRMTHMGPHKTLFQVHHHNTREAALCSTGEQKMLLLALVIASAKTIHGSANPLGGKIHFLLLDEVTTHLDPQHRQKLVDTLLKLPLRLWLTSADEETLPRTSIHRVFLESIKDPPKKTSIKAARKNPNQHT